MISSRYHDNSNRDGGHHFLQIPGPTNVPDRVLRAIDRPTIDHRGPGFAVLGRHVLAGMREIFNTEQSVIIYPASGTGAWEAALVNTLSSGDKVLVAETGHFSSLWVRLAEKLGLQVQVLPGDWRHGANAADIQQALQADKRHEIKAVCVVHNETSTAVTSDVAAVRAALDTTEHPALLMIDCISSLGSIEYLHDAWGVDVSVSASQKGMMLPPGLSFNAVSQKAMNASKTAGLPRAYWDWQEILAANRNGFWPTTPATNLLFGLAEAIDMFQEMGMHKVFARHQRHAQATRLAVQAWGLDLLCADPACHSDALTAVLMPGWNLDNAEQATGGANHLRQHILDRSNLSLGAGLGRLADQVFRIGHLGDLNDISLLGALAGIEMGLQTAGVNHQAGGVQAAMAFLADCPS